MDMKFTLYDVSIAQFIRQLGILSKLLKIAEDHAAKNNIDPETILQGKLADDMKPLTFQIQTASDTSKGFAWRVGGLEAPRMEDNEKTFADLHGRIEKTIEFLKSVDASVINGKEEATVEFRDRKFTGTTFLLTYAQPNFYFHLVTAYSILRHFGAPVGKWDYLGVR